MLSTVHAITSSSEQTYYLRGFQNSGSDLNVDEYSLYAVRIK